MDEDNAEASAAGTTGATASVNEGFGVGGRVDLHYEIDGGDVETASGDIGREEDGGGCGGGEAVEVLLADIGLVFTV